MCYSPEADIIAGVVVGVVGVDAMRHADDGSTRLLASIPLVLAAHQMIEAVAWWGLEGRVSASIGEVAVTAYLILAFGVLPFLVPLAVMRNEPASDRRRLMLPFAALGGAVAAFLLGALVVGGHSAEIGGRYIEYAASVPAGGVVAGLYVVAICAPLLMSSRSRLRILGIVNVPVVIGLWLLLSGGFISLWCVWAAVTSVVIDAHIRSVSPTRPPMRTHGALHVGPGTGNG